MERFIRTVIIAVLLVAGGAAVFSEFTAYRTEQTARMRLYDALFLAQQKTIENVRGDLAALRGKTTLVEESALEESRRLAAQLEDEVRRRAVIGMYRNSTPACMVK